MTWGGKYDDVINYAVSRGSPCKERPESCEPRHVDLVVWDADGVIWHIKPSAIASNVSGPCKKVDDDTIVCEDRGEGIKTKAHAPKPTEAPKGTPTEEQPPLLPQAGLPPQEEATATAPGEKYTPEQLAFLREVDTDIEHLGKKKRDKAKSPHQPEGKEGMGHLLWRPQFQAWYEQRGSGWYRMPTGEQPRPPKDRGKEQYMAWDKPKKVPPPAQPKPEPPYTTSLTLSGLPVAPSGKPPKEKATKPYHREPTTVTLLPTFRQALDELEKQGIKSAVISLNGPGTVKYLLQQLGLDKKFVEIQDTWSSKATVFSEMTKRQKIAPCNAIFVDDTMGNVDSVAGKCALALHMGADITAPIQVLGYIREK